jgi:dTDP-4-dehydrorhamnose 3,5-epimerase
MIQGVQITPLKQIYNEKGDVWHALKKSDIGFVDFGEAYFSEIKPGVVKGWKRHNRFTLNIIVPEGAIRFVIFDDRKKSESFGEFQIVDLSPTNNYARLTIPPGVWMSFQGLAQTNSRLLNIIPECFDALEADNCNLEDINFDFSL